MNYFRDQGPLLLVNGYRIVKIAGRGKNPIENGWTRKIVTAEDCENDNAADRSVGIICGEDVMCVDADIYEHELADRIMAVIKGLHPDCIIPTRYGARPKFAMLFRNVDNLSPTRSPMYTKGEGDERVTAQIEFRGKNQQFVAFGIHPATGKEYEWENGSPEFLPVEDLPPLTKDDFEKIVQEIDAIARSLGYTPPRPLNSALAKVNEKLTPEDLWLLNHNEKLGKTIAQYERDLFDSDLNPADYKDWITAGQAGHFEFDADPMAMEVWDRWSQQASNYKDREEIEGKWRSFRSDKANLVTYRTLLKHIPDGMERSGYVINEKTLAIAISEHLRGTLKFIPDANRWMIYENGHWVDQHKAFADKRIAYAMDYILNLKRVEYTGNTTLKKIVDGLIKKYDTNLPSLLEKVRGYLMAISNMCVTSDIFDADRRYFGVGNGDIDLTTGELLKPDPQRYISRHTNICFVPEADCPRWKQTLRECLDDDEMVDYFQKVVGQAALGQTNKRLIVFLYGFGCNGKSTILEGMRATFGDYQRTASEDVFFGAGGGSTRSDLIDLRGARLIELPETERGGRFNATQMKRITGGDEISVRAPYAPKQERFSLVGIPFIATNYFPDIREVDNGTWGRISLIEFPRNFDNDPDFVKDEHLGEKLALEYEGILNWVIEGALKVQKEGLQKPEKMKKAIDKHREENDVLGQFIEETLVFTGNEKDHVDGRVLNDRWSAYARDSRNKFGLNSRSKLMSEMVRRYRLTSVTVRGVPRLKGVKLREEVMDSGDED
jgi:P4 family phage/plasmid primase-like protien|nr:MAG TPA: dsDNA helicase [Caudoviricetes sp.]